MELRRDLLLGVGSLFMLNLVLALVTIGVFTRMGPAIEGSLRENVPVLESGEEMLAVLAEADAAPFDTGQRARFADARTRAERHAGDATRAPLTRLAALEAAVATADGRARREAIEQIRRLTERNHAGLRESEREARRLGLAGAWFSVFVASFALILGIIAVRRLTHRLLVPVSDLWATLEAARAGNIYRRCVVSNPPVEISRIVTQVNEMLDLRTSPQPYAERRAQADRAVVVWALRQRPHPTFVVDERGQIFAANGPAHTLLGTPAGAAVRLAFAAGSPTKAAARMPAGFDLTAEPVPEGSVWVCEVRETASSASTSSSGGA